MVPCRSPNPKRHSVTHIPEWKFIAIRGAILIELMAEDVVALSDLPVRVADRLTDREKTRMGSVRWNTIAVKLELEVRGEIRRVQGAGRQRFTLGTIRGVD